MDIADEFQWHRVLPFSCGIVINAMYSTTIDIYVQMVRLFTDHYKMQIKQTLSRRNVSSPLAEEFRLVWIQLSSLIRNTGIIDPVIFGIQLLQPCVSSIFTMYDINHSISHLRKTGQYTTILRMSISSVILFEQIYRMCNNGYKITRYATTDMLEITLQLSNQIPEDEKIITNMFVYSLTIYPPDCRIGGFLKINRELFVKIMSIIIIYTTVLIQFDN
uniref:Gustatory receptor 5 n=1 Tax=Drosicha corpulenta TaxID=535978 RepID=A0A0U3UBH8_9HEMI|nr:gustatory receptor 5 [Drosicha corpulenta]